MDPMPLAGQFCASQSVALAAPRYPLTWITCRRCGLVQVLEDIPDSILYSSYNYASTTVAGLVRHFEEYAAFLSAKYGTGDLKVLEIGCNDGVLLSRLPKSWKLVGVDPSDVASSSSGNGTAYELYNQPFSLEFVENAKLGGQFDLITGSNCLAHITNLKDVFQGVHRALRYGGHFWIEVHDCEALLQGNQWDTIYHEHKVEWSRESLANCLSPIGFELLVAEKISLHGGALRACFQKSNANPVPRRVESSLNTRMSELRHAYSARYETEAAVNLIAARRQGLSIGAFGASGRANVYLNQLSEIPIDYIVDESPLRSGKYLPCIGTPVVSRDRFLQRPVDICLITAWNYQEGIKATNLSYPGRWLTAF